MSGIVFINYLTDGINSTFTQYRTGMGAGTLERKGLKSKVPHSSKFKKHIQVFKK